MRTSLSVLIVISFFIPSVLLADNLEDLLIEKGVVTKSNHTGAGASGSKIYWNNGTRLDFADAGFTAKINTLIQSRYRYTDYDRESTSKDTSNFDIDRAKLIVSGTALHEEFEYKLETDLVRDTDGSGSDDPTLLDASITWNPCDWGSLKMGQFKTAVSRQYNANPETLQFTDRSFVSDYFTVGRNRGLQGTKNFGDGDFEISAAVFNGESDGEGMNLDGVDTNHMGVASLRWEPLADMDIQEEGDVDNSQEQQFSLGAVYAYSDADRDIGAGLEAVDRHIINVDANYKYQGWSVHSEFFWTEAEGDMSMIEYNPIGGYAQLGYFLDKEKVEVAGRFGFVDCDSGAAPGDCAGMDNIHEVSAVLNYYFWRHNIKAQLQWNWLNQDEMGSTPDDLITNEIIAGFSGYF